MISFYLFMYPFIYLFSALLGLCRCSLAFFSCPEWELLQLQSSGFSSRWLLLWNTDLQHGHSSCGVWGQLPQGLWDLLRPEIEPMSPALAGRYLTTEPPGGPRVRYLKVDYNLKTLLWKIVLSLFSPEWLFQKCKL